MLKPLIIIIAALSCAVATSAALADGHAKRPADPHNGQVHDAIEGVEVWDATVAGWVDAETFWYNYAQSSDGKFWGRAAEYPNYNDVSEHDTFLVVLPEGTCLMYFFHSRWRRAQDVRRWDPKLNEIAGCPHVFD